ncbi:armadillo repeat only 1 [Actinidia rufa]|uniref:Armadillo repeat only 1 n=1 Tax=Actinidia rufa TaxID=165716 RepID=A0A7J0EYC5_9ERIC|nr:armadillo repeat only 1 [Actinidia rufa]
MTKTKGEIYSVIVRNRCGGGQRGCDFPRRVRRGGQPSRHHPPHALVGGGPVRRLDVRGVAIGLLCLAKHIAKEPGELQFCCLMVIMEITAAAESNDKLRRAAFNTNSPAAKAVVDQVLRVIEEFDVPSLQLPAIKSIGSLVRTFPSRETRVIGPLVEQLFHTNPDVATEAAISLGKFSCPENFVCSVHSKTIIEFDGVPPLMRLLRCGDRPQLHGLILLCYLAMHAGGSEAFWNKYGF